MKHARLALVLLLAMSPSSVPSLLAQAASLTVTGRAGYLEPNGSKSFGSVFVGAWRGTFRGEFCVQTLGAPDGTFRLVVPSRCFASGERVYFTAGGLDTCVTAPFAPGVFLRIPELLGRRASCQSSPPASDPSGTITVTSLDDNTIVDGQVTLREAIDAANSDRSVDGSEPGSGSDEIRFAGGGTILLSGTALPTIVGELTITGPGANALTINADERSRIFEVGPSGALRIRDLTLSNGNSGSEDGGAVANGAALAIEGCTLAENKTAANGGGVFNRGTLTITGSSLVDNSALNGAAIHNAGTLTIEASTLARNFTGGIARAAGGGGGILNAGAASISNSTFAQNRAANGGGIVNTNRAVLTVTNSTFSGGEAINGGGGLSNYDSSMVLVSSTITGNRANTSDRGLGSGGGIAIPSGSVRLDNTIVAGNSVGRGRSSLDIDGVLEGESAFNLIGVDTALSGISHGQSANQIGTTGTPIDPRLGPLVNNDGPTETHALLDRSLAIDAGPSACVPPSDQRGVARPQGSACDVGAFERPQ